MSATTTLGRQIGGNLLGGAARTTGRFGAIGGAGYLAVDWFKDLNPIHKLMTGVAVGAVAIATLNTDKLKSMIKGAAVLAIAGFGGYALYQLFNKESSPIQAPDKSSALGMEDILGVKAGLNTLRTKFGDVADNLKARVSSFTNSFGKISTSGLAPLVTSTAPDALTSPIAADDIETNSINTTGETTPTKTTNQTIAAALAADEVPLTERPLPKVVVNTNAPKQPLATAADTTKPIIVTTEEPHVRAKPAPALSAASEADTLPIKSAIAAAVGSSQTGKVIEGTVDAATDVRKAESSATILEKIRNYSHAAKARFGANLPLIGGATLGTAAVAATAVVAGYKRDYARALHAENPELMPKTALDAYLKFSTVNQALLTTDALSSAIDQSGISIITTAAADLAANRDLKSFLTKHGAHFPQEVAEGLSMSLITPDTIERGIVSEIANALPSSLQGKSPEVDRLIQAKIDLDQATRNEMASHPKPQMIRNIAVREQAIESRKENWRNFVDANDRYKEELINVLRTPEGFNSALSIIDPDDRIAIAKRLFQSESDISQLTSRHPEIADYMQNYSYLSNYEPWRVLEKSPDLMNAYIMDRMGSHYQQAPSVDKTHSASVEDISLSGSFGVSNTTTTPPVEKVAGGGPLPEKKKVAGPEIRL